MLFFNVFLCAQELHIKQAAGVDKADTELPQGLEGEVT